MNRRTCGQTGIHKDRQDVQTDRQVNIQTGRLVDRKAHKKLNKLNRQTYRWQITDRQTNRKNDRIARQTRHTRQKDGPTDR